MFTLDQIRAAHAKVQSGADFPRYAQELRELGLSHYDLFVADGSTIYYGAEDFQLSAPARYPARPIAAEASAEALARDLKIHQQGGSDFPQFCEQAAAAGVEKWTTDILGMEVTYSDAQGRILLREAIPGA